MIVKKFVLLISPHTFAVYLIPESPFISSFIWSVFNTSTWCVNSPLFIFGIGYSPCTVFCVVFYRAFEETYF